MVSNERLPDDAIASCKMVDYAAPCQKLLRKRSDIKTKIESLLIPGESEDILRRLEDAEQRLADVRANSAANEFRKDGTSAQR